MMATVTPLHSRKWRDEVQISSTGAIKPNLYNACLAIRHDPSFKGAVAHNDFAIRPVIQRPIPWSDDVGRYWDANDDNKLNEWLQENDINVNLKVAQQAIETVAYENRYHPVRDWLEMLEWDGQQRIDQWLTYYLGVELTPYSQAVGKAWLVSAVARVMRPGCKADHVLILEGRQGLKKSTALKTLAGHGLFTDEIDDLGSKDAAMQMKGVWIIELGELDHLGRVDASRIKAFLTRSVDRFRPPYGSRLIESERECVFCGTVNQDEYFKDETGNRRFWPVRCGPSIDIEGIAHDREQIWAEAVAAFRNGDPWWIEDRDITAQVDQEQSDRMESDSWTGDILDWVNRQLTPQTTREILCGAISMRLADITRAHEMRVSKAMKASGYTRQSGSGNKSYQKVWVPARRADPP